MRRKRAVILTLVSFILWQLTVYLTASFPCQKAAINDLCNAWKDGDVEGDWCFHLCEAQKSCHGVTHYGKQLVVRLKGPFGRAVAKGRYARWPDSAQLELSLDPTDPTRDFERRVATRILDFQKSKQIDPMMSEKIALLAASDVQREHFLQLMHQREFMWSFLNSQPECAPIFPQLRGTCGHLFIVEESDQLLKAVSVWPMREKLMAIVKVIDLIMAAEERNVQICDFKWEHFGIFYNRSSGPDRGAMEFVIKLLDLDAVFSEQSLQLTLDNYDCETDEDCDFFDCKGHCIKGDGLRKSACVPSASDSNMKRFLKMVSASFFPPQQSLFSGVEDPVLLDYVQQCSSTECNLLRLRQLLQGTIAKFSPS